MASRTIVGLFGLLALFGITIYLLAHVPWEFALGGLVVLAGMGRAAWPPNEPPRSS